MKKPKLGDRISFIPEAFTGEPVWHDQKRGAYPRTVTGTVVYINDKHRFCDVEYEVHGYKLREAFKFEE